MAIDWHARYLQQANWTRALRAYIFNNINLNEASRVLEVGCGTGAVLSELPPRLLRYGLDVNPAVLAECRVHAPNAGLVRGDALSLPFANKTFEAVYCHFLLLWVKDPLQAVIEMKRLTRPGGNIIAFAEPDYAARRDQPDELIQLGRWQTESLRRQGADPGFGARLAETFFRAGILLIETGTIQGMDREPSREEWESEWAVIESDLAGMVSSQDLHTMKLLDQQARARRQRRLYVPTYFAWGQV